MSKSFLSRRRFLTVASAALAVPVLAACGQEAAEPTTAPAAPSDAAKPTTAAKEGATTAPKTNEAAKPDTSGAVSGKVSMAVWTDSVRTFMEDSAKKYASEHPDVQVETVPIPYDDMAKKQLTMLATDSMPDIVYSGVKWFAYTAYKGGFYALDDLVKSDDPGMDDFFKGAITNSQLDGKLYALPFEVNTGNTNIVIFNKDVLAKYGVTPPTNDWTLEDYATSAAKITDQPSHIFGTDYLTTNYYDFATLARTYGGDILSDDSKEFTLTTDPKTVEAARWEVELRTVHKAAPDRADAAGLGFAAGQIGFDANGIYAIRGLEQTVADKFEWDAVLGPKGPGGLRGYEVFTTMFSMYGKTKNVDAAYDLLKYVTSPETAMFAFVEQGQPPARESIWRSDEAQKIHPIWGQAADWLTDGENEGPFPMPDNLRFSELQDKFGNLAAPLFYGEVGFDEGMKQVQEECQKIVALPRG